jgi:hypothetical protein
MTKGGLEMSKRTMVGHSRRAVILGRAASCVLLAALTVAGCGGSGGAPSGAAPSGAPSEAISPPSTTDAPAPAEDGTNFAACSDGNCEVEVSGPVDIPLTGQGGITKLSVTKVEPSGLSFTTTSKGGTGSGDLRGGCTLTFFSGGGGSSCGGKQNPPGRQTGVLAMQIARTTNGHPILLLVAGEPGPPPTWPAPPIPKIPRPQW